MTFYKGNKPEPLSDDIRRQFSAAATTRFLRAQPWFQSEPCIPRQFSELLIELERAESSSRDAQKRS